MGVIETATGIGIIVGAFTVLCVKIIAQFQSNKFKMCKCCGSECVREVEIPTQEIQVNNSVMSPQPRTRNGTPRGRPTLLVD